MSSERDTYSASGVDYSVLDRMKRLAQNAAKSTDTLRRSSDFQTVRESRGESAFVWEEQDSYRASVIEGLGTKHLVADAMEELTGKTYYKAIAQDTVAAIINDLLVVGADPQVLMAYWAVGDSSWFGNEKRSTALIEGWQNACEKARVVWGGGETPALKGVLYEDVIDLGGSAQGVIKPKERLMLGGKLRVGDRILLVESSGIHANGLSLARQVAAGLDEGYLTKMSDGRMYGEALLTPSYIYVDLVRELFEQNTDIHYMVHVTGHGWRKLMRAPHALRYVIENIPVSQEEFQFIQQQTSMSDEEMYGTFNMGAGFAIFVPEKDVAKVIGIGQENGLQIINAGRVEEGNKEVVIEPKGIVFAEESLQVR